MPDDMIEEIEGPKKVKELAKKWDEFIKSVQSLETDDMIFKNITKNFYTCFKDYIKEKNLSKFKKFKNKLGIIPSYTNKVLNEMYQSLEKCGEHEGQDSYLEKFDISSYKKIKTIREAAINNPKIREKIKEAQGIIKNKLENKLEKEERAKIIEEAVDNIIKNMGKVKNYYDLYINLYNGFKNIKCIDEGSKKILLDEFSYYFDKCELFDSEAVHLAFVNMHMKTGSIFAKNVTSGQYKKLRDAAEKQAEEIAKEEDKQLSNIASKVNKELGESSELINYSCITSLFKKIFGVYISDPKLTGMDESIKNMYEEIESFDSYGVTRKNNEKYVKIISGCSEGLDDYKKFCQEFEKCIKLITKKLNDCLPKSGKK